MEVQMLLHDAAADDDVMTIRRLVAEGADVNLQGDGGANPLPWRHRRGMWMRYECWWRLGLRSRHGLLKE
jgi:hypothetical protein